MKTFKLCFMRLYTLILGLIFCLNTVHSQNPEKNNNVKQAKIVFFNEKLDLTSSETNKFWPVYNDYQSRKNRLANERKNMLRYYMENSNNMSDAEITESLNRYIEIEKEEVALLELYNNKFKDILPKEKVLKIYIVEVQFRNYLLKELRAKNTKSRPVN